MKKKLVLENKREFIGVNFGSSLNQIGEIFFSTSMVGYQDLLSDPVFFGRIACMSYPLIGNYGLTDEDYDFKKIFIKGYVVKENNDYPSNFRSTRVFSEAMEENKITGISDVDTREIVKILRDEGNMLAMLCDEDMPLEDCLNEMKKYKQENPLDYVSCKRIWYSRTANPSHTVVIVDLGVKATLVQKFNDYGLNVIVVPHNSTLDDIKKLKPNGIIISSGPSNPNDCEHIVNLINQLKGKYPMLAIGLGAEVMALSYSNKVEKMKHSHNGANISIKNVLTDKIEITTQNHFYDILQNNNIEVTHINVMDNSIEGFVNKNDKIIGIQYSIQEVLNKDEDVINNFISLMN